VGEEGVDSTGKRGGDGEGGGKGEEMERK